MASSRRAPAVQPCSGLEETGTGTGTVLMVAPAAAPPPPNVPTQSPRRQRSLGQGKVCLCYRELCPLSTERIGTVGGMAGWDLAAGLLGCAAHGIRLNGASTRVVDSCRRMTGLPTLHRMYSAQKTGFILGQGRQAEYFPSQRCSVRCRACAFVAVITAWHG